MMMKTFGWCCTAWCLVLMLCGCQSQTTDIICELPADDPVVIRASNLRSEGNIPGLLALRDSLEPQTNQWAFTSYRMGLVYSGNGQRDSARVYYKSAYEAFQEARPRVQGRVRMLAHNVANFSDDLDSIYAYAQLSIEACMEGTDLCTLDLGVLAAMYHQAGDALNEMGDAEGARYYFSQGVRLCQTEPELLYAECAVVYTGYARYHHDIEEFTAAINCLDTARNLLLSNESMNELDSNYMADIYDTYVEIADTRKDLMTAQTAAEESLAINLAVRPGAINSGHSYNNLGRIYIRSGRLLEGEALLRAAMGIYAANEVPAALGSCYENFVKSNLLRGDTLKALAFLDSARMAYHGYPENGALTYALDRQELKDPLLTRARLLLKRHTDHPGLFTLKDVKRAVASVDSIIGLLQYSYGSEFSKRKSVDELRGFYEETVSFAHTAWTKTGDPAYKALALNYLEQGKARILREQQRRSFSRAGAALTEPQLALKGLEKELKQQQEGLRDARGKDERKKCAAAIDRTELALRVGRKKEYRLSEIKYERMEEVSALERLAKKLPPGELVLNYFLGDTVAFVAMARAGNVELRRLGWNREKLTERVDEFVGALRARQDRNRWQSDKPWREEQERRQREPGAALYRQLVGGVVPRGTDFSRLTIIPDGPLGYLPFGALVTSTFGEQTDKATFYLIQDCTINYEFSAGTWIDRLGRQYEGGRSALVVTPTQASRTTVEVPGLATPINLSALLGGEEEASVLEKRFAESVSWEGDAAAQLQQKEDFSDYGVLHFSGHAMALPDNVYQSFLALDLERAETPILMDMPTLSAKRLNLELLVLSACQTADGEMAREEGIISLSRAGAAAGARSVVAAHWKMNQEAKVPLFTHFYEYLSEGLPRDEALRRAKMELLKGGTYKDPYFWAGFVNTGSGDKLPREFFK